MDSGWLSLFVVEMSGCFWGVGWMGFEAFCVAGEMVAVPGGAAFRDYA